MTRSRRRSISGFVALIAAWTASAWMTIGVKQVLAQPFQRRLPALQDPARGDLQTEILNRLSGTGQYQSSDLPRLARLIVLQAIASIVNVQSDLPRSNMGEQLGAELTDFWDQAENFYEIVSSEPLDLPTMALAQRAFIDLVAAQQRVAADLGAFPGVSPRTATHFQSASRMVIASSDVMAALESDLIAAAGPFPSRAVDADTVREQAQLLANELTGLINEVTKSKPGGEKAAGDVVVELSAWLALVQDFNRGLALDVSFRDSQQTILAARRRMWRAEALLARLGWPGSLERRWRAARQRMNSISDEFGLPRMIAPAQAVQAAEPRAAADSRNLAAHVDHAVAWLDEVRADLPRNLRQTPSGARFLAQIAAMRTQLFQLRRRAIAGEPAAKLLKSLDEIERIDHELSDRAAKLAQEDHPDLATRYRNPAALVAKLRGFVAKG